MENQLEFMGAGLATTYALRLLTTMLVKKGMLSEEECVELFDSAQLLVEQQQGRDMPANRAVWEIARSYLGHLAAHPVLDAVMI
jgi:hypothetical protein